ncbi:alpha-1,3-arabinosyltransferase XAT3-like [Salvia hispanica]|uniref:alpha-1,3-arabinosyltransferase XAT3-like n=1 Tax=Salvia hispanica TaxID=49212 RepID=UPI002009C090|nr:alpha-1,3-arabinosyltransferase XAT3-like [Salvia hispanica]
MNDPIFAASFSRYDRRRFGCFALTISLIVALTVFSTFKPTLHPLTRTGDTFSLHLSISAVENILMDDSIINNTITAETEIDHSMLVINNAEPLNVAMNKAETKSAAQIDRKWRNYADLEPLCRALKPGANYCEIEGDVRIDPNSSTIFVVKPILETSAASNWIIEPYPRRGTGSVKKWTVKLAAEDAVPKCDQFHSLPALLFSIGGFTGNHFHDFADLLVPLFTTSFRFKRDVQFLATDYKPWWPAKFRPLIRRLSGGEILDIDREKTTHCYSRLIAGLKFHSELVVDSDSDSDSDSASGATMPQLRRLLRQTYSLAREKTIANRRRRPRLMLISRKKTRILTNEEQISRAARKLGFEVVSGEGAAENLTEFAQLVNSCDAMAGVHGAGLTNMVFLPEKAVVVQIVPLGAIDALAKLDFGKPAAGMRLRYLDYKIGVTESSLIRRYPGDHAVIRDPMSIHRQGWGKLREVYLDNQNVTIDVRRFRATLAKAIKLLRR